MKDIILKSKLEKELSNEVLDLINNNAVKDTIVHSYDVYYEFVRNMRVLNQSYNPKLFLEIVREYNIWNKNIKFRGREWEL